MSRALFESTLVEFCVEDLGWNDTLAKACVSEFLDKFLVIKRHLRDWDATVCSPSYMIDEVWHAAILHTEMYRQMCGPRFINHNPRMKRDPDSELQKRYNITMESYKELFGFEPENKTIWPSVQNKEAIHDETIVAVPKKQKVEQPESDILKVTVCNQSGKTCNILLRKQTPFYKLFSAALAALSMKEPCRFYFDGDLLDSSSTPLDVDMEDGDEILVSIEQSGC